MNDQTLEIVHNWYPAYLESYRIQFDIILECVFGPTPTDKNSL